MAKIFTRYPKGGLRPKPDAHGIIEIKDGPGIRARLSPTFKGVVFDVDKVRIQLMLKELRTLLASVDPEYCAWREEKDA